MTFPCSPSLLFLGCCLGAGEPGCHGNRDVKHPEPAAPAVREDASGEAQRRGCWRGKRSRGVGRCKADRVRNGPGLFCESTEQEDYIQGIRNQTFRRKTGQPSVTSFFLRNDSNISLLPSLHPFALWDQIPLVYAHTASSRGF